MYVVAYVIVDGETDLGVYHDATKHGAVEQLVNKLSDYFLTPEPDMNEHMIRATMCLRTASYGEGTLPDIDGAIHSIDCWIDDFEDADPNRKCMYVVRHIPDPTVSITNGRK